jgi:DNA processing protein
MSSLRERAALVALVRHGQRSPAEYAELVEHTGNARSALIDELTQCGAQTRLLAEDPEPLIGRAEEDIRRWEEAGFALLTVLDADYPSNLREVHDRPPLLFLAGSLTTQDDHSLAVIGSRRASEEGRRLAGRISRQLVAKGFTVVSGLAAGIDTAAHSAALEAGGRTIAVLGTGLARCYPAENLGLQRRIAECGAVVSQFWPEEPPSRQTFPQRNAVMSGLALGTVIVEASVRSGARVQARLALAHGRPVFLMRSLLKQDWAAHLAQRSGVQVVDEPDEIVETVERRNDPGSLVE